MSFKASSKYIMTNEDLIFQEMDLPTTNLFFNDVDVPSNAIPINTCGIHHWDVMEIFPELNRFEKLLSTSPNTFVNSEYAPSAALNTCHNSSGACHPSAKAVPDNVRLRNHDCMWSGRCNAADSHQKTKLKAAAMATLAAQPQYQTQNTRSMSPKQMTPAQSPTKVRTIQAGESLLRQKQPSKCSSNSGDENNNRPDTPQSLGGGEDQDITCTITGSNQLPLLGVNSKDEKMEHEMNKIKEYLVDPAKQQYKAYDNSTTLADVMNTLESGEFNKRDGSNAGQGNVGGYHPMSPAEEWECSSSRSVSRHVVDDDTESENEMDDENSLHDDDEGISLKMMPTSHLNSSRMAAFDTGSVTSRMSMASRVSSGLHGLEESEEDEEDDDEEEEEEEDDEEEDSKADITQTGGYHHGVVFEEEEDSGTERSLYGTRLTVQEKNLIKQQTSMHSDHCYTRVKSRVDIKNLGVDTPSDSEEEVDVVGVGEKNLPTNPSAKDRKALQATVRNRFVRSANSGIVTAPPTVPNSGATTPGGRYYTNTVSGFVSTSNSNPGSAKKMTQKQQRQFAKLDDYYGEHSMMQSESISNSSLSSNGSGRKMGGSQAMRNGKGSAGNRKRPASSVGSMGYSKSSKHYHDSKKSKYSGSAVKGGSRPMQKGYANDYRNSSLTTFTLEKRNLHNDLERQRRVGLKNLFEELKCQIPSLRDKERAPKVSILREAAHLCTELSREHDTLFALRKQRERLLQTARMLKTQLQRSAARSK